MPHEGHQLALLLAGQLRLQNEVEELDRVFQGQQAPIVEVRGRFLDAAEREGLDRPLDGRHHAVDRLGLVEAIDHQVMHRIIGVIRGGVAGGALGLPKEKLLPTHLVALRVELAGVKLAVEPQTGGGRKIEQVLNF